MRFFGSALFGIGLLLFVFLLLAPGILTNFENSEIVINNAVDDYVSSNGDQLFQYLIGDVYDELNITEYVGFCDLGLVKEQCEVVYALDSGNYSYFFQSELFQEQKVGIVNSISEQMDVIVRPVSAFYAQAFWLYLVMLCCLGLGGFLLYFGVKRDLILFFRKIFMRIGIVFLLSGLVMRYLVFKGSQAILSFVSLDAPRVILDFSLNIAFSFFENVFLYYWLPFMVVGLVSFALVFGMWSGMFVRWWKNRS